jgi:hypothetical protein
MKSSGVKESINSDFQLQEYDDLSNNVGINYLENWREIFSIICSPSALPMLLAVSIAPFVYILIYWRPPCFWGGVGHGVSCDERIFDIASALSLAIPIFFIAFAYSFPDFNFEILKVISILFAVYYYGCVLALGDDFWGY